MIAYTAWDGLHAIATRVDADLTLHADGHIALAPHRSGVDSRFLRRCLAKLGSGLAACAVAIASSAW